MEKGHGIVNVDSRLWVGAVSAKLNIYIHICIWGKKSKFQLRLEILIIFGGLRLGYQSYVTLGYIPHSEARILAGAPRAPPHPPPKKIL